MLQLYMFVKVIKTSIETFLRLLSYKFGRGASRGGCQGFASVFSTLNSDDVTPRRLQDLSRRQEHRSSPFRYRSSTYLVRWLLLLERWRVRISTVFTVRNHSLVKLTILSMKVWEDEPCPDGQEKPPDYERLKPSYRC